MSDTYKLQYDGMTLAYPGWNGYVGYEQPGYPITYETDGNGTLTGDVIYIPGSTGVTLDMSYNTYYRLSGYETTGCTIDNGVLIADGPCTARAVYKVNYFTATGGFDKGSNITVNGRANMTTATFNYGYVNKKAIHNSHTGDVDSAYWSASNIWHPSNFSAYSFTANTRMQINATGYTGGTVSRDYVRVTAASTIGTTLNNTAYYSLQARTKQWYYSKSFTTTTQDVYGVSAKMGATDGTNKWFIGHVQYVAAGTTGTWTATGIAP